MHKSQDDKWRDALPEPPRRVAGIKNPYSPARMAWLKKLARSKKPERRLRGIVPGDCIRLGWTDSVVVGPDRSRGPFGEMRVKFPGKPLTETMAHTILPAGREALAAWEAIDKPKERTGS